MDQSLPKSKRIERQIAEGSSAASQAEDPAESHPPRRWRLPLMLFLASFASTFFVGVCQWQPTAAWYQSYSAGDSLFLRRLFLQHWREGLIYSLGVLLILGMHEGGHFLMTLVYRIRASLPMFIPFPISPIGTMGAVIGMQGQTANRRQIFDIGIAGPLAGLIPSIPIAIAGVWQLDLSIPGRGEIALQCPLLLSWMIQFWNQADYPTLGLVWLNQLNPWFVAGWVGLVITGLNMLPIGQLDGGHVTYTLFGRGAHWIARGVVVAAIAAMVYTQTLVWLAMTAFILLIGTDHPPTANDAEPIGWWRTALGYASLTLPFLLFPPTVFVTQG